MSNKGNENRDQKSSPAAALLTAAIIAVLTVGSLYEAGPPKPLPASAPAEEFSAERAISHVRAIASASHPLWSPGDAAARDYIIGQLKTMGLEPQVQEATSVIRDRGYCSAGVVRNVVARMGGTGNTRAVMLAAHYDSVPTGPGASDDGSGVATLLETLRTLKAAPPLRNDVIFLFSDGEEEGLYGAHAFVKEHPWAKDVGVALNFEARGAGGPSFMFETSEDNGWLIKQFIAAAPYPQANSLTYALYTLLPNDTDMTEFKKAGMAGLNFAYIGDWNRYHTMLDNVQNLDRRSLQHDGSYAVAMVRRFGNLDLRWTKGNDATYFNIIGPFMARYPMRFALPLALIAAALFLVMLIIGFKRGRIRIGGMILGLFSSLATIALAYAIGTAGWWGLKKIHPYYSKAPWGDPYNGTLYLVAFAGLTIAASVVIYHWCRKRANVESLASGAALCWLVVSIASAVYLAGGSFIFVWPFLFATLGLMFLLMRPIGSEGSVLSAVVMCVSAAPTVILLSPLVSSLYLLTSLNLAGGLVIVVALMVALLVPQMSLMMKVFPKGFPALAALAAIIVIVFAGLTGKPDANHRAIDDVFYGVDQDTGDARWLSVDKSPDEFTSQFLKSPLEPIALSNVFPWYRVNAISSGAPSLRISGPEAQVEIKEASGDIQTYQMHIVSTRQAPIMLVELPQGVQVLGGSVNSEPIPNDDSGGKGLGAKENHPADQEWSLLFAAVPKEGFELTLQVRHQGNLHVTLLDVTSGLPDLPGFSYKPRPDSLMLAPYMGISDTTIVRHSFDVGPKP